MTEISLDDSQIDAGLEQVRGIGMSKRMYMGTFGYTALENGTSKGGLQAGAGNGTTIMSNAVFETAAGRSGKQPLRGSVGAPMLTEFLKQSLLKRDVAIPIGLTMDVKEHAIAVHVGDLEPGTFREPQATGIYGRQTDPVNRDANFF
jgi:hypothetical protein